MNAKKPLLTLFLFLLSLLLANTASAQEDFTASSVPSAELCPCSSQAYAVTVQNTGTTPSSYEVLASGSASEWAAFKPAKFSLNPRQSGKFFAYVNSACNIKGGYNLSIFIKTGKGLAKAINQDLKFSECYDYSLEQGESADAAKSISFERHEGAYALCKNEKKSIPVLITNNENFENRYLLQLDAPQFAALSINKVKLAAKKSGIFLINIDSANAEGEFNFNVDAISELGNVQRKKNIKADMGECYKLEVSLGAEKDNICSGETKNYNAAVKNSGTLSQNVNFKLDGPEWASIGNSTFFSLKPGEENDARLSIAPPGNVSGNFLITLSAVIENKTMGFSGNLGIEVIPKSACYKAAIDTKKSVKNFYSKDFFFANVKNEGIRKTVYNISLEGAPWVSVSPTSLELNPGQAANLNIEVNPGSDVNAGTYSVKINLESNNIVYSKSADIIVKKENEFLKKAKSFAVYYQYYSYLGLVILVLLIIFRKQIKKAKDAIKESHRQHKIRSQRIMTLKLAREKKAEEKRKEKELEEKKIEAEEEKARKAELRVAKKERKKKIREFWKKYHAWAYALVLLFVIAVGVFFGNYYKFFNAKYLLIYARNFFYGYLYYIFIGIGIVIALFLLLLLYRHISKKRKGKVEVKTIAEKEVKEEKKARKGKKSRYKAYFEIIAAVLIAAALIYTFAYNTSNPSLNNIASKIKDFFVLYSYYIIMGVILLIVIILLIRFYKPLAKMLKE